VTGMVHCGGAGVHLADLVAAWPGSKERPPAWFLNLCSAPAVELQIGRQHLSGTATVIEASNPDCPRLWELMNETNHGRYDAYQAKTSRPIPLVAVTDLAVADRQVYRDR
jgi:F420H(2)-dependent quinone reductase